MSHQIEMLLVEDNAADIRLTKEAFNEVKMMNILNVVTTGEEALDYLYRRGDHTNKNRPDLILLDLNLPRLSGLEVLEDIKSNPDLKRIPVVVLTSSNSERDIVSSYDQYANSYVQKPVDMDGFISIVAGLDDYWFSIVKLPPK